MSAPSAATPAPPAAAVQTWKGIFAGGPYTSLKMLEFILQRSGKTMTDFVQDPVNTVNRVTETQIQGRTLSLKDMQPVWASDTGRCTSFAVKAVAMLDRQVDTSRRPIYQFQIYDLAGHRVARCLKTAVVIDSSSTIPGGAFVLPEGTWAKFEKTDASWKFKNSVSKFERAGNAEGKVAASSTTLTGEQAMYMCLQGVESGVKYGIPTLFRSVGSDGRPYYHGMISWMPYKRCIELVPDVSAANKKKKLIIQWSPTPASKGTDNDLVDCITALEQFVKTYGGPNGAAQWAADGINSFSDQLFAAAVEIWGNPRLVNKMA